MWLPLQGRCIDGIGRPRCVQDCLHVRAFQGQLQDDDDHHEVNWTHHLLKLNNLFNKLDINIIIIIDIIKIVIIIIINNIIIIIITLIVCLLFLIFLTTFLFIVAFSCSQNPARRGAPTLKHSYLLFSQVCCLVFN